jgi:hypothetical protein
MIAIRMLSRLYEVVLVSQRVVRRVLGKHIMENDMKNMKKWKKYTKP